MPTTRKRIVIATLIITCLLGAAVLFSRYSTAPVIAIPENMDPELDGRASFDNEGRMSVTIVNNTMNGGDCLIAQGGVEVVTRYRDDSKYVLRIRIWPTKRQAGVLGLRMQLARKPIGNGWFAAIFKRLAKERGIRDFRLIRRRFARPGTPTGPSRSASPAIPILSSLSPSGRSPSTSPTRSRRPFPATSIET